MRPPQLRARDETARATCLKFSHVLSKARRITPFVTIPDGMARYFFDFLGVELEGGSAEPPSAIEVNRTLPIFVRAKRPLTNQIAQMRFRVRCGERLAADEYRFDDLLSQMTASFQHCAKTFAARPFRTISEHSRRVCVAKRMRSSRSAIFR